MTDDESARQLAINLDTARLACHVLPVNVCHRAGAHLHSDKTKHFHSHCLPFVVHTDSAGADYNAILPSKMHKTNKTVKDFSHSVMYSPYSPGTFPPAHRCPSRTFWHGKMGGNRIRVHKTSAEWQICEHSTYVTWIILIILETETSEDVDYKIFRCGNVNSVNRT